MSMCVRGLALSLYGFRVLGILRLLGLGLQLRASLTEALILVHALKLNLESFKPSN